MRAINLVSSALLMFISRVNISELYIVTKFTNIARKRNYITAFNFFVRILHSVTFFDV